MGGGDVAELDFTDVSVMLTLVEELAGSAPSDAESMLSQSAGTHTDDTVTVYRPYYVAARILNRQLNTRRLRSARGAKFDSPSQTIAALMRQQGAEDDRLADEHTDWTIPEGHEANSRSQVSF